MTPDAARLARVLPVLLLALISTCTRPMEFETMRQTWRTPVMLLDVRLVFRVGNNDTTHADDESKAALTNDTVLIYPVVKVAFGDKQQDVQYLANTPRIRWIAHDSAAGDPGWQLSGRLNTTHKLKDDLRIDWFEIVPVRPAFRAREPIRYTVRPLKYHDWCLELTGRPGIRRYRVRVTYGRQIVTSSCIYVEDAARRTPHIVVRADSGNLGWSSTLMGTVPYREGSTRRQVADLISCDSRGLIAYGLEHIGYDSIALATPAALDSAGLTLFKGYFQYGRLYAENGPRAHLSLGTDLKRGDVIHFTTLRQYGIVYDETPRSGWRYSGIPARLPILRAFNRYPEVKPLWAILWNLRTLFGRSRVRITRYEPIVKPVPVVKKPRRTVPPSAAKPASKPTKPKSKVPPRPRR